MSSVTMKNINEFIVSSLKNVLQPTRQESFDFGDLIDLSCNPQFKFLQTASSPIVQNQVLQSNPLTKNDWPQVIRSCQDFFPVSNVS